MEVDGRTSLLEDGSADRVRPRIAQGAGWVLLALVLWLFATGRWGSYVGVPSHKVYLSEIGLGAASVGLLAGWNPAARASLSAVWHAHRFAALTLATLVVWAAIRTLPGLSYGAVAARDGATYFYGVAALLAVALPHPRRTTVAIALAVVFHSYWSWITLHDPNYALTLPHLSGDVYVFNLRNDFDAAAAGIGGVMCFLLLLTTTRVVFRLLLAALGVWSIAIGLLISNRAGLLATLAAFAWAVVLVVQQVSATLDARKKRRLVVGVLAAVGIVGLVVLTATPAGERLLNTFAPGQAQSTADARVVVYHLVVHYIGERPSRVLFGVGNGPDYLLASGSTPHYDPGLTLGVRAPHDFLLDTYARLGVVGLILHVLVVLGGYLLALRAALSGTRDNLVRFAALLMVALPVAALVGVVLESPFGAVPWFWAYGLLLSRADGRDSTSGPARVWWPAR